MLGDRVDHDPAIGVFRFLQRSQQTEALRRYAPLLTVPDRELASDGDILKYLRNHSEPGIHATGTCRMGADAASVVDGELRVRLGELVVEA